ncbi:MULTISPECIES: hypothetical protein [unclassified Endozoicomonas]|uniref:hypothetical protein n=1 Tax=unclassified Endozoicomonas TaxID=2644528 RepID=UPI00214897F4|nr:MULTISPECIES: hypothetical protein [unclassified Endozoicomonas]
MTRKLTSQYPRIILLILLACVLTVFGSSQNVFARGEKPNLNKIPGPDSTQRYINSPAEKFKHRLEALYPYAFASYLSYRFRTASDRAGVKEALEDRLTHIQYRNAVKTDVPEKWLTQGVFDTRYDANRIYDREDSGLKARVFLHTSEKKILIAFTGTEFDSLNSLTNAAWTQGGYGYGYLTQIISYFSSFITAGDYFPLEVPMLRRALELTVDLYEHYPDHEFELTGSSLGGAIAQYVSFKTRFKAVVFNSLALNSAIYWHIQNEEPDLKPKALITHAYLNGELLNDTLQGLFIQGPAHAIYAQGSLPVEGLEIPVPASEKSLHGLGQFWSRHTASGLLRALEANIQLNLPPLKQKPS